MARFPKKMVLVAAVAELLILAVAGRSDVFSHVDRPQLGVNIMTTISALPNAGASARRAPRPAALNPKKAIVDNEVITIVFAKAPQNVI
jgi:hypothetical protein